MAQVRRLSSKVGSRLALFCIHHVNRVNSAMMRALSSLLLIIVNIVFGCLLGLYRLSI